MNDPILTGPTRRVFIQAQVLCEDGSLPTRHDAEGALGAVLHNPLSARIPRADLRTEGDLYYRVDALVVPEKTVTVLVGREVPRLGGSRGDGSDGVTVSVPGVDELSIEEKRCLCALVRAMAHRFQP